MSELAADLKDPSSGRSTTGLTFFIICFRLRKDNDGGETSHGSALTLFSFVERKKERDREKAGIREREKKQTKQTTTRKKEKERKRERERRERRERGERRERRRSGGESDDGG